MGTRNYALEQIIAKFKKQINVTNKSPNIASEKAILVNDPDTARQPVSVDAKSASMSWPSSTHESDDYEDQTSDGEDLNSDDSEEESSDDIEVPTDSRPTTPIINNCLKVGMKAPLQAKGIYACRMIGCNARLPVCRMLNHARYFHSDFLHTCKCEDPVVLRWTIPSRTSSRKIIQTPYFGLFFFIYNVHKQAGETTINSWVQSVRPNAKAREFYFNLNLEYGDAQVSYKDYVSLSDFGSIIF